MISIGDAVILGVVEGLTEFLPVSSTGHLKITEGLLDIPVTDPSVVAFSAVIQVGAIAAVLLYFFNDIVRFAGAWFKGLANKDFRQEHDYKFAWWIIFGTLPLVAVGLLFKDLIHGPLGSLWVVASALIAGSVFIWYAERRATQTRPEAEITFRDAIWVGSSQSLALLFPGMSRSGATISTSLLLGLDRVAATRLSFFFSIPGLTGAGIYELKDAVNGNVGVTPLIVGTVVSFIVAYASVAWLLRFVAKHSFNGFVIYRIIVGIALFALLGAGVLHA
ncbi:undecaprenyl-diphosphate phosphatase [Pseudonocardiaceae bacterium YIM PH 21723]|nr:undecaprenyl-diphosphate phosphatase [Pseudonocardiaceae bacterium YIM PH 21723]